VFFSRPSNSLLATAPRKAVMVDTSSLSGVISASGFSASSSDTGSSSDHNHFGSDSHSNGHSTDQSNNLSHASSQRITADTSSLSGIQTLLEEPTMEERVLLNSTILDKLSDNNPLPLTKTYESTYSPWTGKGGFTAGARTRLEDAGIVVRDNINKEPAGGITRSAGDKQGISAGKAASINGGLAEQAIADRYLGQGLNVDTQAKFDENFNAIDRAANQAGDRAVDVVVHRPHSSDPRFNEVEHIESKAFRVSNTDNHIKPNQLAHDVGMLENNQVLRTTGAALEKTGRVLRPVGLAMDAISVGSAIRQDGGIGIETGRTVTGIAGGAAGGWGGAAGGAAAGAAIGSAVPVIGTAVGAVVGGVIGGLGGATVGERLATGAFDTIKGWFD